MESFSATCLMYFLLQKSVSNDYSALQRAPCSWCQLPKAMAPETAQRSLFSSCVYFILLSMPPMISCLCYIMVLPESHNEMQKAMKRPGLKFIEDLIKKRLVLASGNFSSKRVFLPWVLPLFSEESWVWKGPKPKLQSQIPYIFWGSTQWAQLCSWPHTNGWIKLSITSTLRGR